MTMLALDWNATRVRALLGSAGESPVPVLLEPPSLDLPTAIGLDTSTPRVGGLALRNCRVGPNYVCHTFLPHLSEQANFGPRWQAGRHSLRARDACELVWRRLHSLCSSTHGIVLTLPSYLVGAQADTLRRLAGRLPVLGSAPTLLTAAVAGHAEQSWQRSVLVVDVDDHALTIAWVKALADKVHLVESRFFTHMGLRCWKERLLNVLSDLCVRQHRRDPRDAPQAEQSLFDHLDPMIDAAQKRQAIQLGVQGREWFKHILVHPDQPAQFCHALAKQAAAEAEQLLLCWPASELPRALLLTHEAGRLPGLVEALRTVLVSGAAAETKLPGNETNFHDEDFGEELMFNAVQEQAVLNVLSPESPGRAAHALAELFANGTMQRGHVDSIVPLLRQTSVSRVP